MRADAQDHGPGIVDWGSRWRDIEKKSFLKQSQADSPEKWQAFYDQVSDIWEDMAGISLATAREMAAVLAGHGLVRAGTSVLEIGCGPGNLSVALAGHGCRVSAMDQSREMIRVLEDKIRIRGITGIQPLAADWNRLNPKPDHDLAVGAFFPEACSPDGISRMENLAGQACVLVMGKGGSPFPLLRQIWAQVMDAPCPVPGDHLACAENFLKQAGRSPEVYELSLPVVMDIELHRARQYFRSYFAIFGCSGPSTDRAIDKVLGPHADKGHLCLEGQANAAMVCWPVPRASSGRRSLK